MSFSAQIVIALSAALAAAAQTSDPTPSTQGKASGAVERVRQLSLLAVDDPQTIRQIKDALADEDWYVRGMAVRFLARLKDKPSPDALAALVGDRNWFVRMQALEALHELGEGKEAAKANKPDDQEVYFRARLFRSLATAHDPAAQSALLTALSEPEPLIREAAAYSLGELKVGAAVDSLVQMLKDDDAAVRRSAACALGKIGDKRAREQVVSAAKTVDDLQYNIAAYRLGETVTLDRVADAIASEYSDQRVRALEALIEFKDERALPVLLALLKPVAPGSSKAVESLRFRLLLADGLAGFHAAAAQNALLGMTEDPAPQVRIASIASIGRIVRETESEDFRQQSMKALVAVLDRDEAPSVVSAALDALSSFDAARMSNALLASRRSDARLTANVVRGLAAVGVTTESQVARLNDADASSRLVAAERLARLGDNAAVKPLLESLATDKDLRVRIKCAAALGELKDRRAVEPLMAAAGTDAPDLRVAAVKALGRIGDHSSTDALFTAAHDSESRVRESAFESLSEMGISVDRVSSDLASPNWQVRSSALTTLERLGDPKALPAVARALKDDDARVRSEAARALGGLGDRTAGDALIGALSDPNSEVRTQATIALGRIKSGAAVPALGGLLNDRDTRVSLAAAEALARMREPNATRVLLNALADPDSRVRSRAAHVLARVSAEGPMDEALGPLARALTDSDSVVRFYAAEALVGLGAKAVPRLIEILKAPRQADRERAARVLWRIGPAAVEPLLAVLEDRSATPEMRVAAAGALGVIGDRRAITDLALLLRDERYFVRQAGARALGQIGEPAVDRLLEMASSSTPSVRESAIEALGSTSSSRAIGRIVEALKDSNTNVRSAAIRALAETRSERGANELAAILRDESNLLRAQAGAALARLGPAAVSVLVPMLNDTRPSTRQLAAEALGDIGSAEAVAPLLELIRRDQSGARLEAIEAVGKIGDRSAIDTLLPLVKATSVAARKKTVAALSHFHDPRVVDALIGSLADQDEEVRLLASAGLGEVGEPRAIPALEKLADDDRNADIRAAAAQSASRLRSQPQRTQPSQKVARP